MCSRSSTYQAYIKEFRNREKTSISHSLITLTDYVTQMPEFPNLMIVNDFALTYRKTCRQTDSWTDKLIAYKLIVYVYRVIMMIDLL